LSIPLTFILAQGPILALSDLDIPIGAVAISPNGWTDNKLGLAWFQQTFVPFATLHKMNDDPILLLLDSHDSHETDELQTIAYNHNVFILAFPSKCTHKLQPLDVAMFAQVQHKWSAHCYESLQYGSQIYTGACGIYDTQAHLLGLHLHRHLPIQPSNLH